MKNILLSLVIVVSSSVANATDLTILNSGSKTGSFAMQTKAYQSDLSKIYDVRRVDPGNNCVAINSVLPTINGPVFVPWASDYEAGGKTGQGCATLDFKPYQIVRYTTFVAQVCSMKPMDLTVTSGRVAHTVPGETYSRVVQAMNKSFNTDHKSVTYNGQGDARLALLNGEVDYFIAITPEHADYVVANGGECRYKFTSGNSSEETVYLQNIDNKNPLLTLSIDLIWLGLNMSKEEVDKLRNTVEKMHKSCNSAISEHDACKNNAVTLWNLTPEEIYSKWNNTVNATIALSE